MENYGRRGYFPGDAESAFKRWRAAAVIPPPGTDKQSLEAFIKEMWLAGWRTRGQVAYGQDDVTETKQ
ncbi:MAG: hypothetical protein LC797_22090 [Chloroflexi bacterium]|nr:hypothetical protein [Chloroflexota bacterium]